MNKVLPFKDVLTRVDALRKKGKQIVSTNGCFDILHVGHVRNLNAAKKLGDVLIVGINTDSSVRRIKGNTRPINPARERAEVLASLAPVDYVFVFKEDTPDTWITQLKPDIHVKGGGTDVKKHPHFEAQKKIIEAHGGKLKLMPHTKGKSTSAIVDRIRK